MPLIRHITVTVTTADRKDSGTDDPVYLGLGGREFRLDTAGDDFEPGSPGSVRTQYFQTGDFLNNLTEPESNDPRSPPLDTEEDLFPNPVYIRKAHGGHSRDDDDAWWVSMVEVFLITDLGTGTTIDYARQFPLDGLKVSYESGLSFTLKRISGPVPRLPGLQWIQSQTTVLAPAARDRTPGAG